MKNIEIEIKVRVSEAANLKKFLKRDAKFLDENYQKDEYFSPAHRDFLAVKPVEEWLRLRTSGKKFGITYKNWHYDHKSISHYCDEYETEVADLEQMRRIFAALDMKPLVTVEKTRRRWRYQDYEISLDQVTGLGDFVEVEYKAAETPADPSGTTSEMIAWLKAIGVGKIERSLTGYPFALLNPKALHFQEV
jgi:adenylate cyclase class 2